MPRTGCQLFRLSLLSALCAIFGLAQTPSASPKRTSAAILRSVKVISDAEGPALEIISSQAPNPTIESLENPSRLVIDLPNTKILTPHKRLAVGTKQISAVRVKQFQDAPSVTRIVLDLLQPVGYSTDGAGERLLVRLHPMAEARQASPEPASVPAFTQGVEPVAVAVSPGSSGAVVEAGSRLAADSSVTAGTETTILHLNRGGEVRVCPGTTLSVTTSDNGHDMMLGMSTGALEANYVLEASADSVLTPDFRMVLAGPGELHYAISADTRGNTCVRALPGNTASVIVSELMGDGTYQVKPKEQILFHSGQLNLTDASVPEDCGCPPPTVPVMRASTAPAPTISEKDLPPSVHLAQPGDETKAMAQPESVSGRPSHQEPSAEVALAVTPPDDALPAPEPSAPHVQVEAPFVFQASDTGVTPAPNLEAERLPMSHATGRAPVLTIAEPPKPSHSVLRKVKGFFADLFK